MRFNLVPILALACSGLLQEATALEAGNYAVPDMAGYVLHRENEGDGDGDGVDETHVKHYVSPAGSSTLFSMTTTERTWAWSLSTPGEDAGIDSNYVIRDSNCDGVFDERYGLDEDFHVPDCLKQKPGILRPPGTPPVY